MSRSTSLLPRPLCALALLGLALALSAGSVEGQGPLDGLRRGMQSQAAFTKGLERTGSLRDEGAAVAWFYRALRNAVVDYYRRNGARSRALAG